MQLEAAWQLAVACGQVTDATIGTNNCGVLASTALHNELLRQSSSLLQPQPHGTVMLPEGPQLPEGPPEGPQLPEGLQLVHRLLKAGARASAGAPPDRAPKFDLLLWYALWILHRMAIEALRRCKLHTEPSDTKRPRLVDDDEIAETPADFKAFDGRVARLLQRAAPTLNEISERKLVPDDMLLEPQWRTARLARRVREAQRTLAAAALTYRPPAGAVRN